MMSDTEIEYKNSSFGKIPTEWVQKKIKEIISDYRLGGNYENSEDFEGIPLIKMGNLDRGKISLDNGISYVASSEIINEDDFLKYNDILFNTRNTLDLVGKVSIWKNELSNALYNSNLLNLKFNEEFLPNNNFTNYALNSTYFIRQLKNIATGTTSVAAIYTKDLLNLSLILPLISEQQKIAQILSTWDKAIQETNDIIKALEKRNKVLAFSLLTGKKRLNEFLENPLKKVMIKEIAQEISLKNKNDEDYTVFSCTKYNGLVPSLEYFGKKIYSDNLTTYKIIKKNQFAYATNHIEEGSIGILTNAKVGLISPMYTIFEFDLGINLNYIYALLKTDFYINEYKRRMEGSIDRRGGLRWAEFSKIFINLPSIEEQNKIAEILNDANKELQQYKQKLENLKQQKKGLMQQLLTGKIRTM